MPGLPHLEVRGVEPEIRPFTLDRPIEESGDALVDLAAQARHLAFRDARHAHGLDQIIDRAGRDALNIGLLDHRGQRLLDGPARFQERREVAALAQLRHLEIDSADPGLQRSVAVAVPAVDPLGRPGMKAGAARRLRFQVHQPLQGKGQHVFQKIGVAALFEKLGNCHSGIGHRGLSVRLLCLATRT